jgi:tRNA/rRNA methyltransferase
LDFYTCMLRCSDGSYYVGHTDDIDARIAQHQSGFVPGGTQRRRPVTLVWSERFPDRDQAFTAERQIKNWSRAKKEALIASDWDSLMEKARKPAFRSDASLDTGSRQARPLLGTSGTGPSSESLIPSNHRACEMAHRGIVSLIRKVRR